jgi:hypothetical protein
MGKKILTQAQVDFEHAECTIAHRSTPSILGVLTHILHQSSSPSLPSSSSSTNTNLRGRSPQANYTDRATAACRRS